MPYKFLKNTVTHDRFKTFYKFLIKLIKIINITLSTAKFPKVHEQASIVLIYEKGHKLQMDNYRLITVTNSTSKVTKTCIGSKLGVFKKISLTNYLHFAHEQKL